MFPCLTVKQSRYYCQHHRPLYFIELFLLRQIGRERFQQLTDNDSLSSDSDSLSGDSDEVYALMRGLEFS